MRFDLPPPEGDASPSGDRRATAVDVRPRTNASQGSKFVRSTRNEEGDASVAVAVSPAPRHRVHPTGRYIRGTLSPTANNAAPEAAGPGGLALLRAARDADDVLLKDILRRAVLVGIPEADLNAVDSSGRVSSPAFRTSPWLRRRSRHARARARPA